MQIKFPSGKVTNLDFNPNHGPDGQFSSGGGGGAGGISTMVPIKAVPMPSKGKQTIQNAESVLAAQGYSLKPLGAKPDEKGNWTVSYRITDKNGVSRDVDAKSLKKLIYK